MREQSHSVRNANNENHYQPLKKNTSLIRNFGRDISNQVNNQSFAGASSNLQQDKLLKPISQRTLPASKSIRDIHTAQPSLNQRKPYDLLTRQQSQKKYMGQNLRSLNEFIQNDQKAQGGNYPQKMDKQTRLAEFKRYYETYYSSANLDFLDVDLFDMSNPQAVSEYAADCLKHMQKNELTYHPNPNCLKNQPDINAKMRLILVEWLIEVHLKFKLLPETLFLTINLIDRYCTKKPVLRTEYQLLGVTAMLIASKYEEIYPPEIRDFVHITDKQYTKEQVLAKEFDMLQILDFNITTPSSYRFLERFSKICQADNVIFNLSRYIIEITLIELKHYKWCPSLIAATALYISHKILRRQNPWSPELQQATEYSETQIRACAKDLCIYYNLACEKKRGYEVLYKKFSLPKFLEVSKITVTNKSSSLNTNQSNYQNDISANDQENLRH
ncbi:UNKNOWN [Stylonychia lemnae]|uniref:Uncharacterized protein n=1 Tax=Stylonychia lemnae TaxID=5949 RepID=A0A078B2X7_STYLE|nr:UNKNOWN [Stylonychia lemnae]|eukprot:CDW87587.1 UNKNOWN [Stylonychia lemnae]